MESHFYDACTKVGDEEGVNKFILLDMSNEIKDSTYHSLARRLRGTSKKV